MHIVLPCIVLTRQQCELHLPATLAVHSVWFNRTALQFSVLQFSVLQFSVLQFSVHIALFCSVLYSIVLTREQQRDLPCNRPFNWEESVIRSLTSSSSLLSLLSLFLTSSSSSSLLSLLSLLSSSSLLLLEEGNARRRKISHFLNKFEKTTFMLRLWKTLNCFLEKMGK